MYGEKFSNNLLTIILVIVAILQCVGLYCIYKHNKLLRKIKQRGIETGVTYTNTFTQVPKTYKG